MSRCAMDAEEVWANRIKDPDAIPAVKAAWTELLEEKGVKVDELKERRETQ